MAIPLKTPRQIKIMDEVGKRLVQVVKEVLKEAKPGVRLEELEALAVLLIEKAGAKPSFKMVKNYHWATCLNINQGVVHGIPNRYRLKKRDLLSIDAGLFYRGFHADMARTIQVGVKKPEAKSQAGRLLSAGKRALVAATKAARPGNRVGHISQAIENEVKKAGFVPVRALTGHGIGKELHEPPAIPCFLKGGVDSTLLLKSGMVLAIEVIFSQGRPEVVLKNDGWTVETADGQPAVLFENTIALSKKGSVVLTDLAL